MRINFVAIWINSNWIGTISGFTRRGWSKSVQMFLVKFNFSDPHICTVGQILFNTADTFCWIIFSYSQFVVLEGVMRFNYFLTTSTSGKSLLFTKKPLHHITPRKITFLGTFPNLLSCSFKNNFKSLPCQKNPSFKTQYIHLVFFSKIFSNLTSDLAAVMYRCTQGPCDITVGCGYRWNRAHAWAHHSVMRCMVRAETGLESFKKGFKRERAASSSELFPGPQNRVK